MYIKFFSLLCLFSIISVVSFSQRLVTSVLEEKFYPDDGGWLVEKEETYEYQNREVVRSTLKVFNWKDGIQEEFYSEEKTFKNNQIQQYTFCSFPQIGDDRFGNFSYFYEDDLLIEEHYFNILISHNGDTIHVNRKHKHFYNDSKHLIKTEKIDESDNVWNLISIDSFIYNVNDCLIEHHHIRSNFYHSWKRIFERSADCSIVTEIFLRGKNNLYKKMRKNVYNVDLVDGNVIYSDSLFIYDTQDTLTEWTFRQLDIEEYNEKGNILRTENIKSSSVDTRYLYTYDEQNRVIKIELFVLVPDGDNYELHTTYQYNYSEEFDDNGYLIKLEEEELTTFLENTNSKIQTQHFTNFCDGTVAIERNTSNEDFENVRVSYEYLDGIDCDFEKDQQPIQVYPNPSSGIFQLKGELLSGASTKIRVLNFVGQLIYEVKVPEQEYIYDLDLSHLNNGNYVLFVDSGEYYSIQKITIFK